MLSNDRLRLHKQTGGYTSDTTANSKIFPFTSRAFVLLRSQMVTCLSQRAPLDLERVLQMPEECVAVPERVLNVPGVEREDSSDRVEAA
mmetsp:Transcript_73265/g.136926  ORF Transcript_73265/g.136926 Transcript_73265/m.136926 type:complete len:89 (+) Transcript_73265:128-394(+)